MKTGRVQARNRVPRADLAGGDIRAGVITELARHGQLRQIDGVAFQHDFLPGGGFNDLRLSEGDGAVAKFPGNRSDITIQGQSQQFSATSDIGDERHRLARNVLEDAERTPVHRFKLEYGASRFQFKRGWILKSENKFGRVGLDLRHKAAQTLRID